MGAESGHVPSQYALGMLYMKGELVPEDPFEGIWWLERAAEAGHPGAQNQLGRAFFHGHGVRKDVQTALSWFLEAGEQGVPAAQHDAGTIYASDVRLRNYGAAHHWFEQAANNGYGAAMIALGGLYRGGLGSVPESLASATRWYEEARRHAGPDISATGAQRLRSTAKRGLSTFIGMFGVGHRLPTPSEVLDAMLAVGTVEKALYPELSALRSGEWLRRLGWHHQKRRHWTGE